MTGCCADDRAASYDLAILGAGGAGFSAAVIAAEAGARVALIGHGTIGGTCVNVGCVPSKTMIRAAEALYGARAAARFDGLVGEAHVVDWRRLIAAKDNLVADLRRAKYVDLLAGYDAISYIEGPARLADGGVTTGGKLIRAAKVIVATGARPALPAIPDLAKVPVLTSTSLLELEARPESLIVLGGGFIGTELAQMMARMGTDVTIVCRSRLLPQAEPEVSAALTRMFRDEGIRVCSAVEYGACRSSERGVTLVLKDRDRDIEIDAERLLAATGRSPNVEHLGLHEAGVVQNERGYIAADDRMRTSKENVYAAGDVIGKDQFVYMAAHGGKVAAQNALNGDSVAYSNFAMPWVVFTDPQVAGVGLTEARARALGHQVKTSLISLDQIPRALAARDTRGLIKLVADAGSDRLLGGQILAPEGADSVQTLVLALKHEMTARQLAETIFPYLTTVEGVRLAAQGFDRDIHKLPCCAG
jgi:mercuric reductase